MENKKLGVLAERILKKETNRFIGEIERLMTEDGVEVLLAEGSRKGKSLGRSQFKTLMDATEEASCIEELLLFLSYQKSKGGGWKNMCGNGKDIAENVANSFIKIQNKIYELIKKEAESEEISDEDERILRLKIAEKYMGYLFWKASVVSRY